MPPRLTGLALASLSLVASVVGAGCEQEPRRSQVMPAELEKICHAVERSGAAGDQTTNRTYLIATWLDQNIRSEEGVAWLQGWAKLGSDKAARRAMLEDAARTYGVSDCPLIDFWK